MILNTVTQLKDNLYDFMICIYDVNYENKSNETICFMIGVSLLILEYGVHFKNTNQFDVELTLLFTIVLLSSLTFQIYNEGGVQQLLQ